MSELYKGAVCNELRNALEAWNKMAGNTNTTVEELDKMREKIHDLCSKLAQLERMEKVA